MLKKALMLSLLLPAVSFGAQKITLREGVATPVTIANHSLNHFSVEDDRIVSIKGDVAGVFEHDMDEKLGHVYLKPILESYPEPIHIFITTEQEKTISLLLNPANIKAESVRLVVEGAAKRKTDAWEKTSDYESVITKLIKNMHNRTSLEGFTVSPAKTSKLKRKPKGQLIKKLTLSYQGEKLSGEVWFVENQTGKFMSVSENDFYEKGVRAVAILYKDLPNTTSTTVYRVISHG